MTDLPLTKLSETATKIVLGWAPPAGAKGYLFFRDDSRSSSLDGTKSQVTFAKGATSYRVQALGVLAEGVYPHAVPPPAFGKDLFEGFEWAQQEIVGTTVKPTTSQELAAALAGTADIIDLGGRTFTPGQIKLPAHSSFRMLTNGRIGNSRVYKTNTSKWRLRGLEMYGGIPEDNVKGENGGYLDIDGCIVRAAPRQGMLLYPHDQVVLRNTRVTGNGSVVDGQLDHGIYAGVGTGLLSFNNIYANNWAWQIQVYPRFHKSRFVCDTVYGGHNGGIIFGSENQADATSDLLFVGTIAANSPKYGFEQWQKATNVLVADGLGWNNKQGDFGGTGKPTTVRWSNGDPLFVDAAAGDFKIRAGSAAIGKIQSEYYRFVPPLDIGGRARVTADAGAWAA